MPDPAPAFGRRTLSPPRMRRPMLPFVVAAVVVTAAASAMGIVAWRYLPASRAVSGPPADDTVMPPDLTPLRAFPNTRVTFYDVPGTDTRAISDYMRTHGAPDGHDHSIGEGWTNWRINWVWPLSPAGCDTEAVRATFSAEVTLPRFVDFDRMDRVHQAGWDRYLNALITHEAGHLGHAYQHTGDVAAAIRGRNCADANAAGHAAIDDLGKYDAAYDAETRHGQTQGVKYPD